jgi:sulfide dehydrogenase [flavocytochrome c] flavoprotein subunit
MAGAASALSLLGCAGRAFRPTKAEVVVIGGGYGGASAAKYLKILDPSLDVTLIEKRPDYLSCPGSNEVLAGWHQLEWLRRSYDALCEDHGIRLIRDKAVAIDPGRRLVRLKSGSELSYDRLILSPGIDFRWDAIEGYDEAASELAPHAWKAGPQTILLRDQLRAMKNGGVVLITAPANPYRCPPGPYERASLIAHYLKRHKPKSKVLILDAKTQFSKQALFLEGWRTLYPGMVEWISFAQAGAIDRIDAKKRMVLTDFNEYSSDVLNVIPPQQAGELAQASGLTDESGWCPVEPDTFASSLQPHVHVIGDACTATPMPKSAFAANSQAKVCAAAIVDELRGNPPGPPSLINNCYSFLAQDYAISITGVYEYSKSEKQLVATSGGETPMDADRRREAKFAKSWQRNIAADTFE